jgi:hypothetical protein
MVVETPNIFKGKEELIEKVFNWDKFYSKGLGNSKEHLSTIKQYENALSLFDSFSKLMNRKFNTYVPEMKEYLAKEGVLEKKEGSPWEYQLTDLGMDFIKSYFKWQVEKENEIKDNKTLVSLLEEKGFIDDSGKLDNKKFETFYKDFEENQNN